MTDLSTAVPSPEVATPTVEALDQRLKSVETYIDETIAAQKQADALSLAPSVALSAEVAAAIKAHGDQAQTGELALVGDMTLTIGIRNLYYNYGAGSVAVVESAHFTG